MLQACNLSKYYSGERVFGKHRSVVKAVDAVNLEIEPGLICGLIGPTGCGKSTLARLLVGLEKPDAGRILIDGLDVQQCRRRDLKKLRRKIQLVFQEPYSAMNSRMTVCQIVQEPLENHFRLSEDQKKQRVLQALDDVGIPANYLNAYPNELSGGQRQRVTLARALILVPGYLILDEPLASLDVSIQAQTLNLLAVLKERFNLTYLFISHDLNAVLHLCDVVAVMHEGRILETLPKKALNNAAHPYTRQLMGAVAGRRLPGMQL